MSGRKCYNCGCTDIEEDVTGADAVCTGCGAVLESGIVVSELQFAENEGGGPFPVGTFVSSESKGGGGTNFGGSFNSGIGPESRDVTLKKARKKILALTQQLRLRSKHVDDSFYFYKLSLAKNLTRGRNRSVVIGACVYITCRTQETGHLLIDFSDVLQVGLYQLGRTYLKLSRALCINIPAMDPCLFVMRFAHKLQLGDKTHQVSMSALRLVSRMKRDWIHLGRRPSSLCGAALLISSRLHQFSRTLTDVIKIVMLHESTVKERLIEFGETSVSDLTIEEFMTADLEAMEDEQDPPSFTRARKKDKESLNLMELDTNINNALSHLEDVIDECLNCENLEERKEVTSASQVGMDSLLMPPLEFAASHVSVRPCSAGLGLKDTVEEYLAPTHSHTDKEGLEEATDELDLTEIDDEEIYSYIMTEKEVEWKTGMWMEVN